MKGSWRKLGALFCPAGENRHPKLLTHAANPLPVQLKGDVYRVFFSGRDARNRSSVGAVDIDLVARQVLYEHPEPLFEHGPEGSFYADGVSIGNCYETAAGHFMLFMGWRNPADAHWHGEIGRLRVHEDLGLSLDGTGGAFMPLDAEDPISLSYPWVEGSASSGFRMWYGSTVAWDAGNGEMSHLIRQASSQDGENWRKHGSAVPHRVGLAQAFSRPTVIQDADGHHMWFSYRSGSGQSYRIGYAASADGLEWQLALEDAGIDVSTGGWDSEMIEYPFVLDHSGRRYMLYNGNGYGRTGFGLAVFEHA
ncbi:hypothetical protein [Variovorax paradoxus]|jgi:hypothetical protein|uniref:hypothetical protein n=1 Tax=Variovorax paradoxus TaxID=34073 RepID=UPI00248033D3|nr:hypothetical protein [Variovorax paradoxus]WGT62681.1 hypothetical protein QHG62_21960 [Variovorax paradoxus]